MNFFVTGTDTSVGKTLISCALLHGFARQGLSVVGMKPVACDDADINGDVSALIAASNVLASRGQINPYSFERPVAPYLAAKFVGVRINLERIHQSYSELATQADVVIVEGAGGFRVPLNESQDGADLARLLKLPVILVVGMRLGCLNHAVLTADAIARCGLKLAGWVANCVDGEMDMLSENIEALTARIKGPLLGVVPHYQAAPDASEAVRFLDMTLLKL
jgi:dethiobiotin synthetase